MPTTPITPSLVASWLRLFVEDGGVVECRALGYVDSSYRAPSTLSGFFDDGNLGTMAELALGCSPRAKGVYFTLNGVKSELLARCANRMQKAEERACAADKDVLVRHWFYIDFDPVRDSLISATDGEKRAAWDALCAAKDFLVTKGWPLPIVEDSGNGFACFYRIDLPADDGGIVKRCLAALAARFNSDFVHVDEKVFNPARITKVPGTWARKGDSVRDRIHRQSRLIEVPGCKSPMDVSGAVFITVESGLLDALAAEVPAEVPKPASKPTTVSKTVSPPPCQNDRERLDVEKWLSAHGLAFTRKDQSAADGRTVWTLEACPFDSSHKKKDAAIMQAPSGALSFNCFHDSCSLKGWKDVRAAIGDPADEHWIPPRKPRAAARPPEINGGVMKAAALHLTNEQAFELFRTFFGLDIDRVIKIGKKRGTFDIILKDGRTIQAGNTEAVLTYRKFRTAVAEATGLIIPFTVKNEEWAPYAHVIINTEDVQDVGSDPQDELKAWIEAFAETSCQFNVTDDGVPERLKDSGIARQIDGTVYISLDKLMSRLTTLCSARIERAELIYRLVRAGFERKRPETTFGETIVRARAWKSKPGYLEEGLKSARPPTPPIL